MVLDFSDLERMAQQHLDFAPSDALLAEIHQYQNAPLGEIADLLEGVIESYMPLVPTLPDSLSQSAKQEIAFYVSLLEDRLDHLRRHSKE